MCEEPNEEEKSPLLLGGNSLLGSSSTEFRDTEDRDIDVEKEDKKGEDSYSFDLDDLREYIKKNRETKEKLEAEKVCLRTFLPLIR